MLSNGPAFQNACPYPLKSGPPFPQGALKDVSTYGLVLEGLAIVTDEIVQPAVDDVARKSFNVVVVAIKSVVASDHPKSPIWLPDTLSV